MPRGTVSLLRLKAVGIPLRKLYRFTPGKQDLSAATFCFTVSGGRNIIDGAACVMYTNIVQQKVEGNM